MDSRRGTRRRLIRPRAIKRRVRRRSGQLGVKTLARFEILLAPTRYEWINLFDPLRAGQMDYVINEAAMDHMRRRALAGARRRSVGRAPTGRMCDHATRARGTTAQTRADLAPLRLSQGLPPRSHRAAPRRGELHACFDHIFHRRTGFVSAPSPFMRLHPKGSMGHRRTNRSASSESLPCVLVYRWSSYFPSSPERPASLMAFDQPEIGAACATRMRHPFLAGRTSNICQTSSAAAASNVRQQRPGPCPCYCVGTLSRLVAGPAA